MTTLRPARALAVDILEAVNAEQGSLGVLLPAAMAQCAEKDRALLQELCFGVCRWQGYLDTVYRPFLQTRIQRKDLRVLQLLRLGCYQLIGMRIPAHAAIFETVALAPALGLPKLKGLVNAILRKVAAEAEQGAYEFDADAARLSHPEWMQAKITHNWPQAASEIFWQNNQRPPFTLRINPAHHHREAYLALLTHAGLEASASPHAPHGITLTTPCDVSALPGFAEGWVSVQDEAAQLCSEVLQPEAGERVLDACAAPGGKTCALLETAPQARVEALDIDAARCRRITENLQRLGLSAPLHVANAADLDAWWDGQAYDAILLDAPCSATGVIRRHPDIKQCRREQDITPLAALQLQLLTALWQTLKPGGRLVYATCSIFPQENNRIIQRFLQQEESAELQPIAASWGQDTGFGRQLLPQSNGHDGFFYARLIKRS